MWSGAGADPCQDGDAQTYSKVGDIISYSYLLTNSGNVWLKAPFTVTDNKVTVDLPGDDHLAGAGGEHHLHGQLHDHAGRPGRRLGQRTRRRGTASSAGNPVHSNYDDETVTITRDSGDLEDAADDPAVPVGGVADPTPTNNPLTRHSGPGVPLRAWTAATLCTSAVAPSIRPRMAQLDCFKTHLPAIPGVVVEFPVKVIFPLIVGLAGWRTSSRPEPPGCPA